MDIFYIRYLLLEFAMCVLDGANLIDVIAASVAALHGIGMDNLKMSIKHDSSTSLFS